jgi:hypothetical protein
MKTWIENFKPHMVVWKENTKGGRVIDTFMGDTIIIQAVCADRVFRVRHKMAIRNARGDKSILRWLGVKNER